jgi:hypothetical protein
MSYLETVKRLEEELSDGKKPTPKPVAEYEINEKSPFIVTATPTPRWWEPGAVCWHCSGAGRCRCIVCVEVGGPLEFRPGPCITCRGSGRIPERVQ